MDEHHLTFFSCVADGKRRFVLVVEPFIVLADDDERRSREPLATMNSIFPSDHLCEQVRFRS